MKMRNVFGALIAGITVMSGMRTGLGGKTCRQKSHLGTNHFFPQRFARLKKWGSNPIPANRSKISNPLNASRGTRIAAKKRYSHLRPGARLPLGAAVESA